MRRIAPGIFLENEFPALNLGMIVTGEHLLLVGTPIRSEDVRSWLNQSSERGFPAYTVLLDHHPDWLIGARDLTMPIVGHTLTSQAIGSMSDSFKGNVHPIGAETDHLKRVTGISRAIPDLTFSEHMIIRLDGHEIELWHQPGPTVGSSWVVDHEREVIFIGDTVTVDEPPYVGDADVEAWLITLDNLRSSRLRTYRIVSARDGVIDHSDATVMARFIRKVQGRIDRLGDSKDPETEIGKVAEELMKGYSISRARVNMIRLRLRAGLEDLYRRVYNIEE
ncbi:MAG: hypothetical protein GTO18_16000 [Anaerolineales bacterium]|nr:hypothetical protein [Anaerolineales bacterium]